MILEKALYVIAIIPLFLLVLTVVLGDNIESFKDLFELWAAFLLLVLILAIIAGIFFLGAWGIGGLS